LWSKLKISETVSNKLQAGYTHFNFLEILFLNGSVINIQSNGSNYIIAGTNLFNKQYIRSKVFQITNNLSYNVGKHAFTFGALKYQFEKIL
jgi:hypothetical protein